MREIFGSSWYLCHRVDAHNELKRLAFGDDGPGVPAALKTASKVVSIVIIAPLQFEGHQPWPIKTHELTNTERGARVIDIDRWRYCRSGRNYRSRWYPCQC